MQQFHTAPTIVNLIEKKLVGLRIEMSLAENKTHEVWKSFMPRRNEINDRISTDYISLKVYSQPLELGNAHQKFDRWAAVEVANFNSVPPNMSTFLLQGGLYAVFHYKGNPNDSAIFVYIFGTWLPNSNYTLDHRPHLEVLGNNFKKDDPNSEEEIWIPIKNKL